MKRVDGKNLEGYSIDLQEFPKTGQFTSTSERSSLGHDLEKNSVNSPRDNTNSRNSITALSDNESLTTDENTFFNATAIASTPGSANVSRNLRSRSQSRAAQLRSGDSGKENQYSLIFPPLTRLRLDQLTKELRVLWVHCSQLSDIKIPTLFEMPELNRMLIEKSDYTMIDNIFTTVQISEESTKENCEKLKQKFIESKVSVDREIDSINTSLEKCEQLEKEKVKINNGFQAIQNQTAVTRKKLLRQYDNVMELILLNDEETNQDQAPQASNTETQNETAELVRKAKKGTRDVRTKIVSCRKALSSLEVIFDTKEKQICTDVSQLSTCYSVLHQRASANSALSKQMLTQLQQQVCDLSKQMEMTISNTFSKEFQENHEEDNNLIKALASYIEKSVNISAKTSELATKFEDKSQQMKFSLLQSAKEAAVAMSKEFVETAKTLNKLDTEAREATATQNEAIQKVLQLDKKIQQIRDRWETANEKLRSETLGALTRLSKRIDNAKNDSMPRSKKVIDALDRIKDEAEFVFKQWNGSLNNKQETESKVFDELEIILKNSLREITGNVERRITDMAKIMNDLNDKFINGMAKAVNMLMDEEKLVRLLDTKMDKADINLAFSTVSLARPNHQLSSTINNNNNNNKLYDENYIYKKKPAIESTDPPQMQKGSGGGAAYSTHSGLLIRGADELGTQLVVGVPGQTGPYAVDTNRSQSVPSNTLKSGNNRSGSVNIRQTINEKKLPKMLQNISAKENIITPEEKAWKTGGNSLNYVKTEREHKKNIEKVKAATSVLADI